MYRLDRRDSGKPNDRAWVRSVENVRGVSCDQRLVAVTTEDSRKGSLRLGMQRDLRFVDQNDRFGGGGHRLNGEREKRQVR